MALVAGQRKQAFHLMGVQAYYTGPEVRIWEVSHSLASPADETRDKSSWRRRSRRRSMPALSEVEGNPESMPLSSYDSNASIGFRAFGPRTANREALSKQPRRASA